MLVDQVFKMKVFDWIYTHYSRQYWACAFYDCQIQIYSLVTCLITVINKSEGWNQLKGRMQSRYSEQEQSHDQAADMKLVVIKTHAVLAVAMAVKP